jgi:hypothetical protein
MPHHYHYNGAVPTGERAEPYHVMIATPTTRGLCPSYVTALAATTESLVRFGIRFDLRILADDCHVDDARNMIIREFLKSDCTDLFFIDSDMGWNSRDFIRLLKVPGDIVAGVYRHKNDTETYPFHPGYPERQVNADGLFEMPKAATGFMRIRRPVLDALFEFEKQRGRCMWPKSETEGEGRPLARIVERAFMSDLPFEVTDKDRGYHSGDYVLCLKARHLGFKIFVDIDMGFDHVGEKVWSGHFGTHLRRERGLDHPRFEAAITALAAGDTDQAVFDEIAGFNIHSQPFALSAKKLRACYQAARDAQGAIVEFGSGLSTLVMGLALNGRDTRLHSFEHDLHWLRLTARWLQRYGAENATLYHAPLTAYEAGDWYSIDAGMMPDDLSLVLIDGPPRHLSERKVAFDILGPQLAAASLWLIDDCEPDLLKNHGGDRKPVWIENLCIALRDEAAGSEGSKVSLMETSNAA